MSFRSFSCCSSAIWLLGTPCRVVMAEIETGLVPRLSGKQVPFRVRQRPGRERERLEAADARSCHNSACSGHAVLHLDHHELAMVVVRALGAGSGLVALVPN